MKIVRFLLVSVMLLGVSAAAVSFAKRAEHPLFGPAKYDVKERYGKPNRYAGTFPAGEGHYLIKLQNGETPIERSDWIEFTVNGRKLLPDGKYGYLFIAGFVTLQKENTFTLVLKDDLPSGFRRPALPPRNVTISVLPVPPGMGMLAGMFGLERWEDLKSFAETITKIKNTDARALAMEAADLQNDAMQRAAAVRKLSDLKVGSAQEYLTGVYTDLNGLSAVRAEAALALGVLGGKQSIPLLMTGVLDPDEQLSVGSARALSFYPEQDTQDLLMKTLERLDAMRRDAVITSIIDAGWKPVSTIMQLAESKDPYVANTGTRLLGGMQDRRATDLLLRLLADPGTRSVAVIIRALGETKDPRAVEPLLKIANDPEQRRGKEAELGEALAELGDPRAAGPIADMLKRADNPATWSRLRAAYRKLTGKDYKQ